jgi:hypothetical protein
VKVKGAKGELFFVVPEDVAVTLENGAIAWDDLIKGHLAFPADTRLHLCHDYPPEGREAQSQTTVAAQRQKASATGGISPAFQRATSMLAAKNAGTAKNSAQAKRRLAKICENDMLAASIAVRHAFVTRNLAEPSHAFYDRRALQGPGPGPGLRASR